MKKIIPFLFLSFTALTHTFAAAEFPDGEKKKSGPITFIKNHFLKKTCSATTEAQYNEMSMLQLRQSALYSAVKAENSYALFAVAKLNMVRGGIELSPSFSFMLKAYKSLESQGYPGAKKEYDDLLEMLSGEAPKAINEWLQALLSKPMYTLFATAVKETQSKRKGRNTQKSDEVVQVLFKEANIHNDSGSFLALRCLASLDIASATYCCYKILRENMSFNSISSFLALGKGDWYTTLHQAAENGCPQAILDYVSFEYNSPTILTFDAMRELSGKHFLSLAEKIDEKKNPLEKAETTIMGLVWLKKGQEALKIIESFQGTPNAEQFKKYFTAAMDPKNCTFNRE
jgi:hypothetical protein